MNSLIWSPKYSVGVEEIDNEHRQLLDLLKQIYLAIENKKDKALTVKAINGLVTYTKVHFKAEENLMLKYDFPEYETHLREHEAFIQKVNHFCDMFREDNFSLQFEMAVFVKNWLLTHIALTDKKCGAFLNKKGVR